MSSTKPPTLGVPQDEHERVKQQLETLKHAYLHLEKAALHAARQMHRASKQLQGMQAMCTKESAALIKAVETGVEMMKPKGGQ